MSYIAHTYFVISIVAADCFGGLNFCCSTVIQVRFQYLNSRYYFPTVFETSLTTINYLNFVGLKCISCFFITLLNIYYALGAVLNTLCILSNTMTQEHDCSHFIDEETEALDRLNNLPQMTLCGGT